MQCLTNKENRPIFNSHPCITSLGGTENIIFVRPKIWEILPHEIKQLESFKEFKKVIKQWKPTYPCRLCKTYIHRLAFIQYRVSHINFWFYHHLVISSYLFHFCLRIVKTTRFCRLLRIYFWRWTWFECFYFQR